MEESKLEKVVMCLLTIGLSVCVGGIITGIIIIIIYGIECELMGALTIYIIGLLIVFSSSAVYFVGMAKIESNQITIEVKKSLDLNIGEKFILKGRALNRNCFINKQGAVIFEDFDHINRTLEYCKIDVNYSTLKILINNGVYSIEKLPKIIDERVIKNLIENLESEIDRLNSKIDFGNNTYNSEELFYTGQKSASQMVIKALEKLLK